MLRADTSIIAGGTASALFAFKRGMAVVSAFSTVVALVKFYVAWTYWNATCNKPLKWYLATEGCLQIFSGWLGVYILCTGAELTAEALKYNVHKSKALAEGQDFQEDPELEEALLEAQEASNRPAAQVQSGFGMPAFVIFLLGLVWYCQSSDDSCDEGLRRWVFGLILYSCIAPVVVLCCLGPALCCLGFGAGAFSEEPGGE